jgi:hypothetical protein
MVFRVRCRWMLVLAFLAIEISGGFWWTSTIHAQESIQVYIDDASGTGNRNLQTNQAQQFQIASTQAHPASRAFFEKELSTSAGMIATGLDVKQEQPEEGRSYQQRQARVDDGGVVIVGKLMWQKRSVSNKMNWSAAKRYCSRLSVAGETDWRMPSIGELRLIVRGCPKTQSGGNCGVTDTCKSGSCWSGVCKGCQTNRGPTDGCYWLDGFAGKCALLWSSSSYEVYGNYAWVINFTTGDVDYQDKRGRRHVRCVRSVHSE